MNCRICPLTILLLLAFGVAAARGEEQRSQDQGKRDAAIPYGSSPEGRFLKDLDTWQERQSYHVVMQKHDYSCGAAALATLMRYYFKDDVTEQKLLEEMIKPLDAKQQEDRQKNGFSMEDLFQAAKRRGYQAAVYPLGMKKLKEIQAPVLVRLIKDDFKHFVVYRGYIDDRIYVADPIRGNVKIKADEFNKQWNGVALIMGKKGFGLPKEHGLAVTMPKSVRPEDQAVRRWLYLWP